MVTNDLRTPYINALEKADDGDLMPLISFFTSIEKNSLIGAIQLANDTISEKRDIEAQISLLKNAFEKKEKQRISELEKVKEYATNCFGLALKKTETLVTQIHKEIPQISISFDNIDTREEQDGIPRCNWFRSQIVETANHFGFYAGFDDYVKWIRIKLGIDKYSRYELVIFFVSLGKSFKGIISVVAFIYRKDRTEEGIDLPQTVTPIGDMHLIFYNSENPRNIVDTFSDWLNETFTVTLEIWRKEIE